MSADAFDLTLQSDREPFYEFTIYPFSADATFQDGLQSILSSAHGKSPEELEDVIGQAKVFYFSRTTGHKITWESYVEWKKTHPLPFPIPPVDPPAEGKPTREEAETREEELSASTPLSFQQITELIQSGQTHLIPNNKIIPEALTTEAPSESTKPMPRKPWETRELQES